MRVLLVFFDTMRYDHASCCGYHRRTTPNIDRLAAENALFLNPYCTDTPTQPCCTSVLTGGRRTAPAGLACGHIGGLPKPATTGPWRRGLRFNEV